MTAWGYELDFFSLPLFFLFCYILISSGFLTNTNQCKTFIKQIDKFPHSSAIRTTFCVPRQFLWQSAKWHACIWSAPPFFRSTITTASKGVESDIDLTKDLGHMSDFPIRIIATAWLSGQQTKSAYKTSYIILQGQRNKYKGAALLE